MLHTITTSAYEFGMTRLFGLCDLGTQGLLSGWAMPEDAHVWNDGPEAVFEVTLPKPKNATRLVIEGVPFLSDGSCKKQEMTLYVNGARLGFWRLTELQTYTLVASIEPEHFFERQGKAFLKFVWYLPFSVKPSDLGINADGRELGFCFHSFTIEESL